MATLWTVSDELRLKALNLMAVSALNKNKSPAIQRVVKKVSAFKSSFIPPGDSHSSHELEVNPVEDEFLSIFTQRALRQLLSDHSEMRVRLLTKVNKKVISYISDGAESSWLSQVGHNCIGHNYIGNNYISDGAESSWLSQTRKAEFFRTLSDVFPELLDLLCSTDPGQTEKLEQLHASLQFLCWCILSLKDQKRHLHEAVHHCFQGPLMYYLTLDAGLADRRQVGRLLAMLVPAYQNPQLRPERRISASASASASAVAVDDPFRQLVRGTAVVHAVRGAGYIAGGPELYRP